jgi:hypothetical protein
MKGSSSPTEMEQAAPDDGVVVDVVFEGGLLYLELANLADRPALKVRCRFEPPLVDLQGRNVTELPVFREVAFLGPRRRIRTLLDSSAGYFARKSARRVKVTVEFERPGEARRTTEVAHDLAVFRELAYLT